MLEFVLEQYLKIVEEYKKLAKDLYSNMRIEVRIIARDYNINIAIGGGNRRGAFSGGNVSKTKTTLNTQQSSENGDAITSTNMSRIFTIGLAFNTAQKGNELLGAYTENRRFQTRVDFGLRMAKYGIGIALNPVAGGVYAIGDIAYRGAMFSIKIQKQNRQADFNRRLSGNSSFSGTRYRGEYQ